MAQEVRVDFDLLWLVQYVTVHLETPIHVIVPVCSNVHLETPVHVIVPVCSRAHLEKTITCIRTSM